ncbi:MAG: hypothetical protein WAM82_03345 [Thermoanaerobaculia bacterium]
MNQKVKEFDSVQLMRRLRDQLSDEMAQMSPQERILYIQRKAAASPLLDLFSHKTRTGAAERLVRADDRERPVIHDSFAAWVEAEVLHRADSQGRLDGLKSGGNRKVFGRFKHQGRTWKVHGDTKIERVLRAYQAMKGGRFTDALAAEPGKMGYSLNLVKVIRKPKEPKHFYVYEVV